MEVKHGSAVVAVFLLALVAGLLIWNSIRGPEPVTVEITVVPTKVWPSFTCQEDEIMAWLDRSTRQASCVNIEEFEAAL